MQDTVLEPGQTFSLNDEVGPRTVERGFVEAPVYYQGFTTDVGGGVSQLSTTVFNAAWWGGFEIVEHQPHSIWITRYPAGREATLNYGSIDNKFRNNSAARRADPHVVHRHVDHGDHLRRQGRQGGARGEPRRSPRAPRPPAHRSSSSSTA